MSGSFRRLFPHKVAETPIMGIVSCLGLMATLPGETWLQLLVWLAIGFIIYFGYSVKHSVLQKQRDAAAPK